ncbi:MAG: hypothetical protein MJZ33_13115 [Paludibacteraceae bacterium]|nr:hypothetical protein [Paludibacteraceae bacterium]
MFFLNTGDFSKASVKATKYNSVSFHDGVGYACGDDGRVAKYTDGEWRILKNPAGGEDWVEYVLRTSGNLTHIVANDRQTAYAMTADGRLIKTIEAFSL